MNPNDPNSQPIPSSTPLKGEVAQTFLTHRMSDAAIMALNTGRAKELSQLQDAIRRSLRAAPGALQHVVIYGPRGFGKSFTARVVQVQTQAVAAAVPIPFVLLPEEQINLTRNPHALPDYIAHRLADLRTGEDRSWADAMFQWPDPRASASLWSKAVARLEEELNLSLPGGKGLAVVVVENFDLLLATVFKDELDEQRLRAWLDRSNNRLMLIATATGSVDIDYDRPLFQAFQSISLPPWPPEAAIEYFNRRRAAEGRPPLDDTQLPKARAVADFIGGNPRLAQLLAEVLDTHDALSVAAVMDALADRLADYYRRRIDDLPPLARGLLDALIRAGEPASQTELARRVGAPGQATIARTMQDLQRADVVRGTPALDGRETLYRVTDRVFVHFYRVRQGQQAALRTPLVTILDFLQAFYTAEEKRAQALRALDAGRAPDARLFASLAREGPVAYPASNSYQRGYPSRWRRVLVHLRETAPWTAEAVTELAETSPEELVQMAKAWRPQTSVGQAARIMVEALALVHMGLEEAAEHALTLGIETARGHTDALMLLLFERVSLRRDIRRLRQKAIEDAQMMGRMATEASSIELRCMALLCAAWSLSQTGPFDAAVTAALEAAAVAGNANRLGEQVRGLGFAVWSLLRLERYQEALDTARQATVIASRGTNRSEQAESLRCLAWSLASLGNHEEALDAAYQAVSFAVRGNDVHKQVASHLTVAWLLGQLGRHESAVATAHEAASLAANDNDRAGQIESLRVAASSLIQLGRRDDAVATCLEVASIAARGGDFARQAEVLRQAASWTQSADLAAAVLSSALENQRVALKSTDDQWLVDATVATILAARFAPSNKAITVLGIALSRLGTASESLRHDLLHQRDAWLGAAVRANAWSEADAVLAEHGEVMLSERAVWLADPQIGSALGRVAANNGRAAAFEATREVLLRLRRWLPARDAAGRDFEGVFRYALLSVIDGLAKNCRDGGLLRDVAGLFTAELWPSAPDRAALLLELAALDEAPDPQKRLARVDPDVAVWLRRIRNLPPSDAIGPHDGSQRSPRRRNWN